MTRTGAAVLAALFTVFISRSRKRRLCQEIPCVEGIFGNNLRIPCWGPGGTNLWHIFPCLVKLLARYFLPPLRFKDLQNSRFARTDVHSVFKSSQSLGHYSHANTLKMQSALISV